jgi:uncharacterized protein (TIGR01615 family)
LQIDDESDSSQESRPTQNDLERQKAAIWSLQQNLRLDDPCEQQVFQVVQGAREVIQDRGDHLSCDALAKVFHGLGYKACVRTALGGGHGLSCMENLSHQFLVIQLPMSSSPSPTVVVDIEFKEQFELAQSTKLYEDLLDELGPVFIGSQSKVQSVVTLLCDEMSRVFKVQGQVPPPWRRDSSMMSKWCPRHSEDKTPTISSSDDASLASEVLKQIQNGACKPPDVASSLNRTITRSPRKSN